MERLHLSASVQWEAKCYMGLPTSMASYRCQYVNIQSAAPCWSEAVTLSVTETRSSFEQEASAANSVQTSLLELQGVAGGRTYRSADQHLAACCEWYADRECAPVPPAACNPRDGFWQTASRLSGDSHALMLSPPQCTEEVLLTVAALPLFAASEQH